MLNHFLAILSAFVLITSVTGISFVAGYQIGRTDERLLNRLRPNRGDL